MNEPKRRGRPPKVDRQLADSEALQSRPNFEADLVLLEAVDKEIAAFLGVPVDAAQLPPLGPNIAPEVIAIMCKEPRDAAAQAYALRVWSGQSVTVPRNERIKRVTAALEGQGLSMEGVVLP